MQNELYKAWKLTIVPNLKWSEYEPIVWESTQQPKLPLKARRIALIDTEADTRGSRHLLTCICIQYLIIDEQKMEYRFGNSYRYDCYERFNSDTLLEAQIGGLAAFIFDLKSSMQITIMLVVHCLRNQKRGIVISNCGLFADTIFLAHNMAGYDSYLLINFLTTTLDEAVLLGMPDPAFELRDFTSKGTTFLRFKLASERCEFRDTHQFMRSSLDSLAKTYGLKQRKGFVTLWAWVSLWHFRFYCYKLHQSHIDETEYLPVKVLCKGLPPLEYYIDRQLDTVEKVGWDLCRQVFSDQGCDSVVWGRECTTPERWRSIRGARWAITVLCKWRWDTGWNRWHCVDFSVEEIRFSHLGVQIITRRYDTIHCSTHW